MISATRVFSTLMLVPVYDDGASRRDARKLAPNLSLALGTVLAQYTAVQNNQQTLTGGIGWTAGTYDLVIFGQRVKNIAFGATAATIRTAVAALLAIGGSANVNVTGGPLNTATPLVFTFQGDLAGVQVPLIVIDTSKLTGTQATTIAHSQDAHTIGMLTTYADGVTDPAVAILATDFSTDADGNGYLGLVAGVTEHGEIMTTAEVFYGGTFRSEDLVGMDANGLADLQGRIVSGSLTKGVITF